MRRRCFIALFAWAAALAGCRHAAVTPPAAPVPPPAFHPPICVQLVDGTTLFGRVDPAGFDFDPGFAMPPIPWERITVATRTGGVWRVETDDQSVLEGRRRRASLKVFTALGGFDVRDSAIASLVNPPRSIREVCRDRLDLCLPFDERQGTILRDAAPNNLTGEVKRGGWTSNGRYGGALALTLLGLHGCAVVPDHPALDAPLRSGAITISLWLRCDGGAQANHLCVVSKNNWREFESPALTRRWAGGLLYDPQWPPYRYEFYVRGDQCSGFSWGQGFEWRTRAMPVAPMLASNGWVHLAITSDYWVNRCNFYVNGKAALMETSRALHHDRLRPAGTDLLIGRYPESQSYAGEDAIPTSPRCPGDIDELMIFHRVLTQEEVKSLARSPFAPSATLAAPRGVPLAYGRWRVETADGSRLAGYVPGGGLEMRTQHLGTIRVPAAEMVRLTVGNGATGETMVCKSGDILRGRVPRTEPLTIVTSAGAVSVPWSEVNVVYREEGTEPDGPGRTRAAW